MIQKLKKGDIIFSEGKSYMDTGNGVIPVYTVKSPGTNSSVSVGGKTYYYNSNNLLSGFSPNPKILSAIRDLNILSSFLSNMRNNPQKYSNNKQTTQKVSLKVNNNQKVSLKVNNNQLTNLKLNNLNNTTFSNRTLPVVTNYSLSDLIKQQTRLYRDTPKMLNTGTAILFNSLNTQNKNKSNNQPSKKLLVNNKIDISYTPALDESNLETEGIRIINPINNLYVPTLDESNFNSTKIYNPVPEIIPIQQPILQLQPINHHFNRAGVRGLIRGFEGNPYSDFTSLLRRALRKWLNGDRSLNIEWVKNINEDLYNSLINNFKIGGRLVPKNAVLRFKNRI